VRGYPIESLSTYAIGGGSNAIGATGYVAAVQEILVQMVEEELNLDHIVVTSGSSGTHAGLLTGLIGTNTDIPVTGVSVSRNKEAQTEAVYDLLLKTAKRVGLKSDISRNLVVVEDDYIGPGYSLPTPEMKEAVKLMAKTEGILLDPVYTGKAFAGLLGFIKEGRYKPSDNILFIHTGGSPALYAYKDDIVGV
jgi:D-cysteine desulfhydrase